jgi:phosphonate transport system substrate-binding protein
MLGHPPTGEVDAMLRFAALLALCLGLAAPSSAHADATARPASPPALRIGLIPELNIFRQKARFTALGDYLGAKIGVPFQFTILPRYGNVLETFDAQALDGAFFGSFTGALAIERLGVVPLARPVNVDGTSTYHGYVFVRRDSGLRSAADLRGRRMAFVDRATTAGYLFPLAWLRQQGVSAPERHFAETFFTGSHDAAVAAVLDRKADVGAAKHSVFDQLRRENPRVARELVVLADSPSVPSNGLCVRKTLDPALRERLRRALLEIDRDPAGAAALAAVGALRFVETSAADYGPVFALAAAAGLDLRRYEYRNH